ncbi:uncharacterized protein PHACADRAFT_136937 [Phanerochaete carnosa HHB-10118-sp]|uniref:Uncharacterized protein n=1 Tax=Phanerochaete carnosa (strain HHB-10118-sp) TaxID=650164 RepID=K5WJQ6_PHACS|nr:uncharacterized protein PHACADRAFT_136937 [Phanerochaete carnosa HHB-10118-sp]EKM59339.1 hypothetical protein PHACADRAFT_136937 [Phanerochaete carnosa HHB-10118-sp]
MTSSSADVYAQELRRHGHGEPLWFPEPVVKFGEVLIGDVGYLDDGGFYRLFNVLRPADDPINVRGVPKGFVPLEYDEYRFLHTTDNFLASNPIYSQSMSCVSAGTAMTVKNAGFSYTFKCHREQGAVVIPGASLTSSRVHKCSQFPEYMRTHHESWYAFAKDDLKLIIKPEDIILVYGCVKTDSWALAAARNCGESHTMSFSAKEVPFVDFAFDLDCTNDIRASAEHRVSPPLKDGEARQDQCLFLRYFRMRRALPLMRLKPKAQAEPRDPQPWNDTESSAGQ